jgi:hypothetical protein
MEALGVDVGGVISNCDTDQAGLRLANPETYLRTPFMPGMVPTLRRLVAERFGDRTYLVSKCRVATQIRTMEFLKHANFFEETGIAPEHVYFCLERAEKAPIARRLRLTHFVDDRLEVLSHMVGIVPNLYLFKPDDNEVAKLSAILPRVQRVESAQELAEAILG